MSASTIADIRITATLPMSDDNTEEAEARFSRSLLRATASATRLKRVFPWRSAGLSPSGRSYRCLSR